MAYAVEIYFDAETDRTVRKIWEAIAEAGLNSYMLEANYRPHFTLGVCEELDVAGMKAALDEFAEEYSPLPLALSSLGIFPGEEGVLFLGVTVARSLLDLHAAFHRAFAKYAQQQSEYYTVGNWIPHCTLAYLLSEEETIAALEIAREFALPLLSRTTEIGISEVAPDSCQQIYLVKLSS